MLPRALLTALLGAGVVSAAAAAPARGPASVVVELFTSQGCSSCPSSDATLDRLARDPDLPRWVVPLSYHVPYWNRLGWADPFSLAMAQDRQYAYTRALGKSQAYTPQLVINGARDRVGTGSPRSLAATLKESRQPAPGTLEVRARLRDGGRTLEVEAGAQLADAVDAARLDVVLVVYENHLSTAVPRGENTGRRIENSWVVRASKEAFSLAPEAGASGRGTVRFRVAEGWVPANLGVAALLQDDVSLRVLQAWRAPVQSLR